MKKAWNPPFIHGKCLDPDLCDVIGARTKSGEQRDERSRQMEETKDQRHRQDMDVRKTNSRTEIAVLLVTNRVH